MAEKKNIPGIRFKGFEGEWEEKQLGNESEIIAGGTPSTINSGYWEPKEVPWMSSGEINKKRVFETDNLISKEGLNNSSARWIKKNSVLIALAGQGKTRGTVAINTIPLTTNQSIAAIIPAVSINYEFLFQNLGMRYEELRTKSSGDGSRGGLNKQIISEIKIVCPIVPEQSRIGTFFQHLDHLITLHQNKYNKLSNIKKAMLEKMFPKNGAHVPEIRFKGFKGEWEEKKLGEVISFLNGRAYRQEELLNKGKYIVLRVGNLYTNDSWYYSDMELGDKFYAENGDLLYSWSASFGPHIWNGEKVIYHYHIWKLVLSKLLDKIFTVYLLDNDKKKILNDKNGSTMVHITKVSMEHKSVLIPEIEEQQKIGTYFQNLDKLITLQQTQIEKLKNIKKACLEKMFV